MTAIWVAEVELGESFAPVGVSRQQRSDDIGARVLVRLHRQMLGFVWIPASGEPINGSDVRVAVHTQLTAALARHLEADGIESAPLPEVERISRWSSCSYRCDSTSAPMSVVVCTRDRPAVLGACLRELRSLQYGPFEVLVVDNAPSDSETRACVQRVVGDDPRFRYVLEPVGGLSRARNRGLREARHDWVAFTDDDARVDRWWLEAIAAGRRRDPRAACVTGLVPPAELDHPAQLYFDRRYSWSRRMESRVYDHGNGRETSPLYPYSAGLFGTGANFAVDRVVMQGLGGFDEALGAGSPAGGGEDLDAFVRILRSGYALVYEPSAIVWHVHRTGSIDQRRQLFHYGLGLSAFLSKCLADRAAARELLARVPAGTRRVLRLWNSEEIGGRAPIGLVVAEALGMAVGPVAYVRGRRRCARREKRGVS